MSSESQNSTELLIKKLIILGVIVSVIVVGWAMFKRIVRVKRLLYLISFTRWIRKIK